MLRLKIVSPESIVYDGPVDSVTVPGTMGAFQILNNHAPIISSLEKGIVEYAVDGERKHFSIDGGFVEVQKNQVSLCVEMEIVDGTDGSN